MTSVSHTRKVAFRRCRRLHHLAYHRGIRPVKVATQLAVGSLLHLWLECWFLSCSRAAWRFVSTDSAAPVESTAHVAPSWVSPSAPLNERDAPYMEVDGERSGFPAWEKMESEFAKMDATDPFEAARLRAMVLAYHLKWRGQDCFVQDVERSFRAPLVDPNTGDTSENYERDGKIDAVIMESPGVFYGVEHKSVMGPLDPDDDYWVKLRSDAQCSDYHVGADAIGFPLHGIIYDVVCKPDVKPLSATPEAKREMTIGIGCKACGGGKDERGTGLDHKEASGLCPGCKGDGWKPSGRPRYKAHVRLHDETPGEYGMRCFQIMVAEPDRYLHRRLVVRLEDELMEHLRDDWETVADIDADSRRDHHPRNPDACFVFGGGGCEYRPICWGGVDPLDSPLYQIRKREPVVVETAEEGTM